MSESDEKWSFKDFLGGLLGGAALAVVGVMMIINPNGGDDVTAEGRRGLVKLFMKYIWSTPGGIVVALIGLLIIGLTIRQAMTQSKN